MSRNPLTFVDGSGIWPAEMRALGDMQSLRSAVKADRTVTSATPYPDGLITEATLVIRKQFRNTRILCGVSIPCLHTGSNNYVNVGVWLANPENTTAAGVAIPTVWRTVLHSGTRVRKYTATGILTIPRFGIGSYAAVPICSPTDSAGNVVLQAEEPVDIWAMEIQ